jgi:hypothetical protein
LPKSESPELSVIIDRDDKTVIQSTMDKNKISILSAFFAFLSVCVAWYALHITRKQLPISVAIEVSRSYLHDRDAELNTQKLGWCGTEGELEIGLENRKRFFKLSDDLEYIALLANRSQLDPAYLSSELIDNIGITAQLEKKFGRNRPEMRAFLSTRAGSNLTVCK